MADVALASQVIASHYAEPVQRSVKSATALKDGASEDSQLVRELSIGEPFLLLDDTLGWAWGYAGEERRVGYVRSEALSAR